MSSSLHSVADLLSVIVVICSEPRYCFQLDVKSQCLNENADNGMLLMFS